MQVLCWVVLSVCGDGGRDLFEEHSVWSQAWATREQAVEAVIRDAWEAYDEPERLQTLEGVGMVVDYETADKGPTDAVVVRDVGSFGDSYLVSPIVEVVDHKGNVTSIPNTHECEICGGDHGESAHGEPIALGDWSVRTVKEMVEFGLDVARGIADNGTQRIRDNIMKLEVEWKATRDDEEDPEITYWTLDQIESFLSDAGFVVDNNAYSDSWIVYKAVRP